MLVCDKQFTVVYLLVFEKQRSLSVEHYNQYINETSRNNKRVKEKTSVCRIFKECRMCVLLGKKE